MGDDGVLALTRPLQHLLMLTALDLRLNAITAAGLTVLGPCIALLPVLQVRASLQGASSLCSVSGSLDMLGPIICMVLFPMSSSLELILRLTFKAHV